MRTLKFKHNPCEEHIGVETGDDWCPYCLINESNKYHILSDKLRVELDKADGAGLELMVENENLRAEVLRLTAELTHWRVEGTNAQNESVAKGQALTEARTEVERLRAALERFAKIDLTGAIGIEIAWDILNARAALKEGKK